MSAPIGLVNVYEAPTVIDPVSDSDAIAKLFALRRAGSPIAYSVQVFHYDNTGTPVTFSNPLGDITASVAADDSAASIRYDCTGDIPGSINLRIKSTEPFTFGSDRIHVYSLMRSTNYNTINGYDPETYIRFDMGYYVVTTPGRDDIDIDDQREITGYGLNYLLKKGMRDSYAFAAGSKAGIAIQTLMRGAGVLGSTAALSTICDFQGSFWDGTTTTSGATDKILAQPLSYPLGGSVGDFLTAINEILKAAGQRAIYTQNNGRWMIEPIPDTTTQAVRWMMAGSPDPLVTDYDLLAKTVEMHATNYNGDVFDVPNQFIFIQNGLDFEPGGDGATDGSSGLYQIDNLNVPPSGQNITNEIRPTVIGLDAMGQADLVTQGNAYYQEAIAQIETLALTVAPWPVLRHFDIFYFVHASLDFSSQRRLQAQSWEYFLFGAASTIATNAIGLT